MVSRTLVLGATILSLNLLSMDQEKKFDFKAFFEKTDYAGKTYLHRIIKIGTIKIEDRALCRCHSSDLFDEIPDENYRNTIERSHPTLLKTIIDTGIDLNIQDTKGRTPLYYAARYKNDVATKLLLDAGANPNIQDNNGVSPLIAATSIENNGTIIEELLNHGALTDDLFASTPAIFVKDHEDEKTIETALKTCTVNAAALMQHFNKKSLCIKAKNERPAEAAPTDTESYVEDYFPVIFFLSMFLH